MQMMRRSFIHMLVLASIFWAHSIEAQTARSATNIAKPVHLSKFENRIWKRKNSVISKSTEQFSDQFSTLQLKSDPQELMRHIPACGLKACPQEVFVAGVGYINGHTGGKDSVAFSDGQSTRHLGLLTAMIQAEGLTNAYVAIFDQNPTMPSCALPIEVESKNDFFHYGSWSIRALYALPQRNFLTQLRATGGDANWYWELNLFITMDSNCRFIQQQTHHFSVHSEESCKADLPDFSKLFAVTEQGTVRMRQRQTDCLEVRTKRRVPIRIGDSARM